MASSSIASQVYPIASSLLPSETAPTGATVLILDPGVPDYTTLAASATPGTEVYLLDGQADGIEQIMAYLQRYSASTVHIISHGAPGQLHLGDGELNLENLETYAEALATWFQGDKAELLLYGCNVAAGDAGTEFLKKLHDLTGATISASTRPIGNGTWHLNARAHGDAPQPLPLASAVLAAYPHTLATFTVDIAVDEDDGNYSAGNLSLREAIALANATPGDDTITFGGVFADNDTTNDTITLSLGELTLSSDITIDGSGGDPITVSGNNATRVFYVNPGATVTLNALTLTNGNAGGGLGGGLYNQGTLTLTNSTLRSNTAFAAGGIWNEGGTLAIANSTLRSNTATSNGGGMIIAGGTVTLTNSTISSNTAGGNGGGIDNNGNLTVVNSTFSGNSTPQKGGALWNFNALSLSNSTFSGNTADSDGGGLYYQQGTINTLQTNLFADSPVFGYTPNTSNLVGTATALGLDPTLANNGGPTQTHALLEGSIAINAATDGTATDQRGVAVYGTRDIGAYEYNPFVVTNTNDSGVGSLRWAIANANATPGDDTITFAGVFTDGNTSNDTITLTTGELLLSSNLTINGSGGDPVTISGGGATRVFYVDSGATVALQNLTIANGKATEGGGLLNKGTLSLSNSTFSNNSAGDGGGLFNYDGTITTLSNSTFSSNSATGNGGGLFNFQGTITALSNSTFSGNSATGNGGGLYNYDGTITTLSNSTFSGNSATAGNGDGLFNFQGTITTLTNSLFSNNFGGIGGGIHDASSGGVSGPTYSLFYQSSLSGVGLGIGSREVSDALIEALADNGGPTQTHALLPYSPALDAAVDGTTTDQRGSSTYGTRDIGAYEVRNHAPTSASDSVTFDEDTAYAFQSSNFAFTDSDSGSFSHLKITALPTVGTFFLDTDASGTLDGSETDILLDQVIPIADLGKLTFRPAPDANGVAYATFSFKVGDGISFSTIPYTMTLDVTPVNDSPTGAVTITGIATQGQTLTASNDLTDADGLGPITYQWQADNVDIDGATGTTFLLTQAQVGKVITVKASYVDGFKQAESVTSAATMTVTGLTNPPPLGPAQIIPQASQVLLVSSPTPTHLTATVTTQGAASVLDVVVILVDDAEGRIDGLLPSDGGYAAAALGRTTTLMSVLQSENFAGQFGRRSLGVAPGQFLQLALIQGGSLDDLKRGGAGQLLFATGAANGNGQSIVQYSPTATGLTLTFTLPGSAAPSITLQLGLDSTPAPVGSQPQGLTTQSELLDLTGMTTPTATLSFEVFREASFNNLVGLYTVQDTQGRVRDPLTGNLIAPGEAGYQQAALANRVVSNLSGQNGQTLTYTAEVATGQLLSTFLVVSGPLDALLDTNPGNDPTVFFNHIAANGDGQDHVRLLGDNVFGFEDIFGGGDQDFDDVIVKVSVA